MYIGYEEFKSGKKYLYMKEEIDGPRTFLRNILFIHHPESYRKIAVVHEFGSKAMASYEPPKGQMEWKEVEGMTKDSKIESKQLVKFMKEAVLREIGEEAKFLPSELKKLKPLPFVYEETFEGAPYKSDKFRYQFWSACTTDASMIKAQNRIKHMIDSPHHISLLPADVREKDHVCWFELKSKEDYKYIRRSFSLKMTKLYYDSIDSISLILDA
jgi:hypothetical protein